MPINTNNLPPEAGKKYKKDGTIVYDGEGYNQDGSLNVRDVGAIPEDITLLDSVTTSTAGTYIVGSKQYITIEIFGTATSAVVNFRAISTSRVPRPMMGLPTVDEMPAWSGGMNQIWQFTVTGLYAFEVDVDNIVGGSVSVKGTAI